MSREMKDSGIEWIGKIPKAWEVAPLKRFAKIQTGNTPSKAYEALFYADEGILWIKPDNLGTGSPITYTADYLTPEGRNAARVMPPNTVYVCCIGSLGKVGYSLVEGCCNQQINALIYNDRMYWKYGYYLTLVQESRYLLYGNGNVLQIINVTNQGNIECVVPSLSEQKDISNFLDGICVEIDSVLEKTRASIEEYKKLKQAVIAQAVTKGIRGDREMKDSGIEWNDKIPAEWDSMNPKALFRQRKDKAFEGEKQLTASQQHGIMFQSDYMELTGTKVVTVEKDFDILKHVEAGDFVISMRSFQGGLEYSELSGSISSAYVMLVPNLELVYPRFYRWLLKSEVYIRALQSTSNMVRDGQAMRYSNFSQVRLYTVPMEEQEEIAKYLDEKCKIIDNLIAKKEQYLSEIENYKKSLIFEYVTGKREVPQE